MLLAEPNKFYGRVQMRFKLDLRFISVQSLSEIRKAHEVLLRLPKPWNFDRCLCNDCTFGAFCMFCLAIGVIIWTFLLASRFARKYRWIIAWHKCDVSGQAHENGVSILHFVQRPGLPKLRKKLAIRTSHLRVSRFCTGKSSQTTVTELHYYYQCTTEGELHKPSYIWFLNNASSRTDVICGLNHNENSHRHSRGCKNVHEAHSESCQFSWSIGECEDDHWRCTTGGICRHQSEFENPPRKANLSTKPASQRPASIAHNGMRTIHYCVSPILLDNHVAEYSTRLS